MTRQVSVRHAAVTSKPFSRKRFRKVLHPRDPGTFVIQLFDFSGGTRQTLLSVSSSKAIERMGLIPSIDEAVIRGRSAGTRRARLAATGLA
jgi:hypothetical protein